MSLVKGGINLNEKKYVLQQLLEGINAFLRKDYIVKLGSILDSEWRGYYTKENFKILIMKIKSSLEEG